MNLFKVKYISGNSLQYKEKDVEARSADEAICIVFGMEGHNFENRLVGVVEIEEIPTVTVYEYILRESSSADELPKLICKPHQCVKENDFYKLANPNEHLSLTRFPNKIHKSEINTSHPTNRISYRVFLLEPNPLKAMELIKSWYEDKIFIFKSRYDSVCEEYDKFNHLWAKLIHEINPGMSKEGA